MTPSFGRLPSVDPRNGNHPMMGALPEAVSPHLATVRSWRFIGDPLNQGETATCVGHTGAHFIHCAPIAHGGFLNAFDLYREAVPLDEYPDNDREATMRDADLQSGTSGTGVAKALSKRGLLSSYLWADSLDTAIGWILTRGPVMFGGNWYSSMSNPTPEGYVKITPAAQVVGGHEWLWRGVDLRRGIGEGINSWGVKHFNRNPTGNWSSGRLRPGHFLFDLNDVLRRLFVEGGDAVSGIEKRPT